MHNDLVCRWAQTFHNTDILGLPYSCEYCYPVCDSIQFLELLREINAQLLFQIHIFYIPDCSYQTFFFECCVRHSSSNLFLHLLYARTVLVHTAHNMPWCNASLIHMYHNVINNILHIITSVFLYLDRLQKKCTNCKRVKNNTNFGQITNTREGGYNM